VSSVIPNASVANGVLTAVLVAGHGALRVEFDGVIDQTALGEVVGLEILDLRSQLGDGEVPPAPRDGLPRWSYDDEIDAFYIRLTDDTAPIQKRVCGTAVLEGSGLLVSLEVPV
jgi:hypothetical protein